MRALSIFLLALVSGTASAMPVRNPALGGTAANVLCGSATHGTGYIALNPGTHGQPAFVTASLSGLWGQRVSIALENGAGDHWSEAGKLVVYGQERRADGSDGQRYALTVGRNGYGILRNLESGRVFDSYVQCNITDLEAP